MLRRAAVSCAVALAVGCGDDPNNPFTGASSRPPSADAVLLFVSGSWDPTPGQPREILALNADGTKAERLTGCTQAPTPCDVVSAAPSPDRNRVAAIRTTKDAEPGASALYFMDLSRSVETVIFPNRRVASVDYSADGTFIIFEAPAGQASLEDLFYSAPNGQQERNLTESLDLRELNPRIDPFARTAVFERLDAGGVSRIYLYPDAPLTSGPAPGPPLPGSPYVVGADADPAFSPDGRAVVFRRLTGTGNGDLGTWDLLTLPSDGSGGPTVLVTGGLFRGAPDWGRRGILYVETNAASSRSELVLVQPDGSGRTVLRTEDSAFRMGAPRWLPGS